MPRTCLVNTIEEFCRVVAKTGLVEASALERVLRDFGHAAMWQEKYGHSLTGFTSFLVAEGVLTCWQVEMLRDGKHKGFVFDGFTIVDFVHSAHDCLRYRAVERQSGKCVVLCVKPPSKGSTSENMDYWIEDEWPSVNDADGAGLR